MYIRCMVTTDNHQLIPFSIPAYLAQFLAHKLNTHIRHASGLPCIKVDRSSIFGKSILRSLEIDHRYATRNTKAKFFLKISNNAGDHYPETPNGKRHFLKLKPSASDDFAQALKSEFEEALLMFVKGAEFAHAKNGWTPSQKRKGIRKSAILSFCEENEVNLEERTFDSLFKMVQRHINLPKHRQTRGLQRFVETLSY